jgi:hypothetical protein
MNEISFPGSSGLWAGSFQPDCLFHQDCDHDAVSDGRGLRRERKRNFLPANAADVIQVTLIITEQVTAIEHQDPRGLRVALEGRR